MAKQAFTLAGLEKLGGGQVARAFDVEMRKIVQDVEDRPGEKRSRKLTITVDVVPETDERGIALTTAVGFDVSCKLPSKKSTEYRMSIDGNAHALNFNPHANENADQMTIDQAQD